MQQASPQNNNIRMVIPKCYEFRAPSKDVFDYVKKRYSGQVFSRISLDGDHLISCCLSVAQQIINDDIEIEPLNLDL